MHSGARRPSASGPWSDEQLDRWARLRRGGMRHFIWSHGVLRWGGFMFWFSLAVFQYAHFGTPFSLEGNWLLRVLLALLTWTFVGYGYGRSQWHRNEAIYRCQRPDATAGLEA